MGGSVVVLLSCLLVVLEYKTADADNFSPPAGGGGITL